MKIRFLLFGFSLFLLLAGTFAFAGKGKEDLALAEFSVRKLTCTACAQKIDKALAALPGIKTTQVDVTGGRASVTFAPTRVSAGTIAETISAAGYPAGLLRVVAADADKVAVAVNNQGAGCACCDRQGGQNGSK